jgi:hypothetical protein
MMKLMMNERVESHEMIPCEHVNEKVNKALAPVGSIYSAHL